MKKFFDLHNSRNRMILLCCVDILTMIVHLFLSLIFRYEFKYAWVPLEYIHSIKSYMVINIVTTLVIFLLLNLYNSVWTFAGLRELTLIGAACFLSTICQAFGMQILVLPVPRSYHIFLFLFTALYDSIYQILLSNFLGVEKRIAKTGRTCLSYLGNWSR